MSSFYENSNFLNVSYAVDIALENHFSNLLFYGDSSRLLYASNEFAMRKRTRDSADSQYSTSNLNLPFMNYYTEDFSIDGDNPRWHVRAYTTGVYVPELEQKVIYAPMIIEYEATFWCNRDDELRFAFNEAHFDSGNKTVLTPTVEIDEQEVPFTAWLSYTGMQFDPEYNENDWLERNNIHSAALDFQIQTFALKSNSDISLTEEVIFNFASDHGFDTYSVEEAREFLVNHLTEEVTPK